jgi:hypothetical protein
MPARLYDGSVVAGFGILLHAATLFAAPLELGGDSVCPPIDTIAGRVAELAPGADAKGPVGFVEISRAGDRLRLELRGADGTTLSSRELDGAASCDDLADAAAVVIATWQNDLDPRAALAVELPAEPARPGPTAVAPVASPPPPQQRRAQLGIGVLGSAVGGVVAPGASLRAAVDLDLPWLGLGAVLGATTAREVDVGTFSNAATWTRGWLGAGPEVHWGGTIRVEGHVQGVVGLLRVAGADVPDAASDTMLDLGVGGGLSVARWVGNAAVWLGVDALAWPGRQRLLIANRIDEGRLPRLDLQLAAGLALGRGR